jgi:hypothetical protein
VLQRVGALALSAVLLSSLFANSGAKATAPAARPTDIDRNAIDPPVVRRLGAIAEFVTDEMRELILDEWPKLAHKRQLKRPRRLRVPGYGPNAQFEIAGADRNGAVAPVRTNRVAGGLKDLAGS